MSEGLQNKRNIIVAALVSIAVVLYAVLYFLPIWWVSLTAPNYPPEAFPDGVRIHFHMNGVFNGCQKVESAEIDEDVALDCVHEMDTINHFVGMYPIASGGVIEKAFSPFLISMLAVMLFGFMITNRALRLGVMAVGFGAIAAWMYLTYYTAGGLAYQNAGYVAALVTSLDQSQDEEQAKEELHPIIAELKRSLQQSGEEDKKIEIKVAAEESGKAENIKILKDSFENDQNRKPAAEREDWTGSGMQVLFWHYHKALGRWFNNPEEINPMVRTMKLAGTLVFWGVIVGMLAMLFAAWRTNWPLYWLLVIIPMLLPAFFIIEYSAWLWWYGHSLNEMGAFTLKPFMPTVFGQGKVAQFSTHSYPQIGFGLMVAASVVLLLAALIRRKALREAAASA